ncbi:MULTISPECIES: rhodanese-like domain-containing protein [Streptomyces]|uniref:rhodanese-like domain-containing protein n=1 Tax=Streptomyces TaxID=1883 RepID=UPI001902E841|nr:MULTISPECIES: rhodanese-like domain-containing protein [unclassified Streptomyces]MCU4746469.1 rhodanese-like domain-containing protein [Streptomyces sp. G-5]QQN76744.1 sulfurtransferase [Streptomyces sp. XC 2026]
MTTIDEHLSAVRAGLDRLDPQAAQAARRAGAVLVDTRPAFQREADGTIPGALIIERNHLEWRCDPASGASVPEATGRDVHWIVLCDEGYASSLAAVSLRAIGLRRATDLIGGFQAWRRAGLPVTVPDPTGDSPLRGDTQLNHRPGPSPTPAGPSS